MGGRGVVAGVVNVSKRRNDGKRRNTPKVRAFTNLAGTRRPMKVVTIRNNGAACRDPHAVGETDCPTCRHTSSAPT